MTQIKNRHSTMNDCFQFIVLVCLVSWFIAGVAIWFGIRPETGLPYMIFCAAYMFIPAGCAIVLQKIRKKSITKSLKISFKFNWWFLIAMLTPIVVSLLSLGINLLFADVNLSVTYDGFLSKLPDEQAKLAQEKLSQFPPVVLFLIQLIRAIFAGCTINAFLGLGEELGWRGYLLKVLNGKKFWTVSLIIGTVWGIWHFPLILLGHNYPQHPVIGVFMMTILCILLTPTMIYIVLKSQSIITAAIYHGTFNAIAVISILYVVGGNDLTNSTTGLSGFIVMAIVTLGFVLYDRYITKENVFFSKINW